MKKKKSMEDRPKKNNTRQFFKGIFIELGNHRMMTLIVFVLIIIFAIIIWTVSSANNVIVAGGSTSVSQIMANITEQYRRDKNEDILYNSLGSAAALVGVKNGSYAFGFLSKDVSSVPKVGDNGANAQELWTNYKTTRFVFARDYISLFYQLPTGCRLTDPNKPLEFEQFKKDGPGTKKIQGIYMNSNLTWQSAFGSQLTCTTQNSKFYTLTREAGSGTRDFFESGVIFNKKYETNQVASSNGGMFQAISTTPGSIGYISFSYIKQIASEPRLGLKSIATVQNASQISSVPYVQISDKFEFNPEYPLTRPFTGIINYTARQFPQALRFIAWMLDPLPYARTKEFLTDGVTPNPEYVKGAQLTVHDAAYWYIDEGEQPLLFDDIYFKKYNNNSEFAKSGQITTNEPVVWNFNQNYQSIWETITNTIGGYDSWDSYKYEGIGA